MPIAALLLSLAFTPHVRTSDPAVATMLAAGLHGSAAFRTLVEAIENSDVIVHIERRLIMPGRLDGMTRFVTRAGGVRYVRVTLNAHVGGRAAVALLAHELQHVKEIAQAEWVVDRDACRRLFEIIGYESCHRHVCFDTAAAVRVGRFVWNELSGERATADRGAQ